MSKGRDWFKTDPGNDQGKLIHQRRMFSFRDSCDCAPLCATRCAILDHVVSLMYLFPRCHWNNGVCDIFHEVCSAEIMAQTDANPSGNNTLIQTQVFDSKQVGRVMKLANMQDLGRCRPSCPLLHISATRCSS
jgi:hypothetical protein